MRERERERGSGDVEKERKKRKEREEICCAVEQLSTVAVAAKQHVSDAR